MRKITPKALMNQGGKWDSYQASYTKEELADLAKFIFWKDPLDTKREKSKERWFDGTNETPVIPNWTHLKRRNLWVCHFEGYTMEVGPSLTGKEWILYLEGIQLGKPGSLEQLKEEGTKFLLVAMLAKEKEKSK